MARLEVEPPESPASSFMIEDKLIFGWRSDQVDELFMIEREMDARRTQDPRAGSQGLVRAIYQKTDRRREVQGKPLHNAGIPLISISELLWYIFQGRVFVSPAFDWLLPRSQLSVSC